MHKQNTMLMFAYGMNTNLSQMTGRCPAAQSLGRAILLEHVFQFSYYADVANCADSHVEGVLWSITPACLQALDQLEGFPTYYDRQSKRVSFQGRVVHATTYFMQSGYALDLPSCAYFDTLLEGYAQHNIPTDQLYNARNAVSL